MDKRIVIGIAGTDGKEHKDVAILPGTRAQDVLNDLKLQGFSLARPEGGMFGKTDDVFGAVADGQKLYAVKSDVEAGR